MKDYKDFQDLKDTDEQTLRNLFLKRTYARYIEEPLADDIIISNAHFVSEWKGDKPEKIIYFDTANKVSIYEERMELRDRDASAAYQFSKTSEIESAKFEISYWKPSEIENRYLRKRVEAYLKVCRDIENEKKILSGETVKLRKELSFKDLFIKEETVKEVDRIFEENGYTKDDIWIDSGPKKRIATAFYVLKDEDPDINVIKLGNITSQLIVFCKHYGIAAAYKGGDVTIKNLLKRPEYERTEKPDYREFVKLFNELKKKK